MESQYFLCDVFTDRRFCGNQLAVLTDARGLTDGRMQQIAREFNFSETTFVFPPETGNTRKVRIFTPATEVPFAGHPNIGTAFVLASTGELGEIRESSRIVFEEKAGLVPITISGTRNGTLLCELQAPEPLSLGQSVPAATAASAISLPAAELVLNNHPPQVASVGLSFLMVELRDRSALERAAIDIPGFRKIEALGIRPMLHLYTRSGDDFDIRCRMFAPFDGVPEDPATGSANCALAGLLAHLDRQGDGRFAWRIAQGVEMDRPSLLHARAEKKKGTVTATWIGGSSVMTGKGVIYVDISARPPGW